MRRSSYLVLGMLCWIAGCSSDAAMARRPGGNAGASGFNGAAGTFNNGTAGTFDNGTAATAGTAGIAGVGGVAGTDDSCASVRVNASRVIPTVQLVIDGSGSMEEPLGGTTRWAAVHDALLAEQGVVQRLDGVVEFGMSIYQTGGQGMDACPTLTGPPPALNNFDAINSSWLNAPDGSTPTAEAMEAVVASMEGPGNQLDTFVSPQIIILATDGAPNGCAGANIDLLLWIGCAFIDPMAPECSAVNMMLANEGYARTLQAAHDAQAKGIQVYVLDLSDGGINQAELQKVANVGVGLPEDAMPAAPLYVPTDPASLSTALETIIGGAATCSLSLQGELQDLDGACSSASEVSMSGVPLSCDDTNGWRVVDATHIELVGEACENWLSTTDASIDARFPCNVIRPE